MGDEVFSDFSGHGRDGFAECIAARESALVLKSTNLPFAKVAAEMPLAEAYCTHIYEPLDMASTFLDC